MSPRQRQHNVLMVVALVAVLMAVFTLLVVSVRRTAALQAKVAQLTPLQGAVPRLEAQVTELKNEQAQRDAELVDGVNGIETSLVALESTGSLTRQQVDSLRTQLDNLKPVVVTVPSPVPVPVPTPVLVPGAPSPAASPGATPIPAESPSPGTQVPGFAPAPVASCTLLCQLLGNL